MTSRWIFTLSIFVLAQTLYAQEPVYHSRIKNLRILPYGGERLKESKKNGRSGVGYMVDMEDGDYSVVDVEDLTILRQFLNLNKTNSVNELKDATIIERGSGASEAFSRAILNAKMKGRYQPPDEYEFIGKLALGFGDPKVDCPRVKDFIDARTSRQHAEKIFKESSAIDFAKKLQVQINNRWMYRAQNPLLSDASVSSVECPATLKVRGDQRCYQVKSPGKVTTFLIGPYSYAGLDCETTRSPGLHPANKGATPANGSSGVLENGQEI